MTTSDDLRLVGIAWRLDRLRWVPFTVLDEIVRGEGACMCPSAADEPRWLHQPQNDRELAERLCAACLVQDECLELELRAAGEHTIGVWGGLFDDDRRTVHLHWLRRGERAEGDLEEGPER